MAADEPPGRQAGEEQPATLSRAHRRTVWRVIVATQLVLVLLTAATVVLVWRHLDSDIAVGAEIPRPAGMEKPVAEGPKEPLNILVMGSDDRSCEGCGIDGETGSGGSDTTMLLHVSADRKEAYAVSLPRDAIVDRPRCETAQGKVVPGEQDVMFNTAFSVGGPLCTVQMVQKLTGIYIDHFIVLDFNGFKEMVDAVGGVEVCIPKDVSDPEHNIFFEAGVQEVSGQQALNYVRERTVLSQTGDIGRMRRQQAFLASMTKKVMSAGTLTQPTKVVRFLQAVIDSIEVDAELDSVGALADLAMQLRETGLSDIKFLSVPFETYPPDPNRLQWTPAADRLWARIKADQPLGRDFSDEALSANRPVGTPSGKPSPGGGGGANAEERAEALAAGLCA